MHEKMLVMVDSRHAGICYTSSITIKIAPVADVPEPGWGLEYVGVGLVYHGIGGLKSTWELPGRRMIEILSEGRISN